MEQIKSKEAPNLKETTRKPIVKLEGVYKIFKQGHLEVIALKNVSFEVFPGELVVIMGPSGSGKTTLLNVISGMENPNAGKVQIKDLEVTRLKDEGIQKLLQYEIGIIFQFFNLIPSLTAAGNVELPMNIIKIPKEQRKKRVKKLLHQVGLQNRARHRPFTLSGGEKQRVAIAQAFANDPSLILADEPTGNIDSISAEKIMNIFHQTMIEKPNKAMIIVTHDPAFRKIADRTLILRDGEIIRTLGKIKEGQELSYFNSNLDEMTQLTQLKEKHTHAKTIIQEHIKYPYFEEIEHCPKCNSLEIFKKLQKNQLRIAPNGQQIIGPLAIACLKCKEINFQTTALYNIKDDLD